LTTRPIVGRALRERCPAASLRFAGAGPALPAGADAGALVVLVDVATARLASSGDGVAAVVLLAPPAMTRGLEDALAAGSDALLTLADGVDGLAEALRAVAGGDAYVSPTAARLLLARRRARPGPSRPLVDVSLSRRERDVLRAMVDGLTTKATARRLGIAVKTVEAHRGRVFDRLGVRTQTEAVTLALTNGELLQ